MRRTARRSFEQPYTLSSARATVRRSPARAGREREARCVWQNRQVRKHEFLGIHSGFIAAPPRLCVGRGGEDILPTGNRLLRMNALQISFRCATGIHAAPDCPVLRSTPIREAPPCGRRCHLGVSQNRPPAAFPFPGDQIPMAARSRSFSAPRRVF